MKSFPGPDPGGGRGDPRPVRFGRERASTLPGWLEVGVIRVLIVLLCLGVGPAFAASNCAEAPVPNLQGIDIPAPPDFGDTALPTAVVVPSDIVRTPIAVSPRPPLRPCKFSKIGEGRQRMREHGALCDDWTIVGEPRRPFAGTYRGCGIGRPVQVHSMSDIRLSQKALMDCRTAITLNTWIETMAKPAFADLGGGLDEVQLVGHYACRTQNNRRYAPLSEHARGRAVDISAFHLRDGTVVSVRDAWNTVEFGPILRRLHREACGLFGTVLGPAADKYHRDHFHLDTAQRRKGALCR